MSLKIFSAEFNQWIPILCMFWKKNLDELESTRCCWQMSYLIHHCSCLSHHCSCLSHHCSCSVFLLEINRYLPSATFDSPELSVLLHRKNKNNKLFWFDLQLNGYLLFVRSHHLGVPATHASGVLRFTLVLQQSCRCCNSNEVTFGNLGSAP